VIAGIVHLARLARGGFVFAREGVFGIIDPAPLPLPARLAVRIARLFEKSRAAPNRLAAALTRLGPTYVKLGQFLATRPDVVGVALARDLESLQDKMPPFPQAEAERAIEAAFGRRLADIFAAFGPSVAAASIAQVHRAEVAEADLDRGDSMQPSARPRASRDPEPPIDDAEHVAPDSQHSPRRRAFALKRGNERSGLARRSVAVKVLRPGIERRFKVDLDAMSFAARNAERFSAEARRLRLIETVETLRRSVTIEMDLRLEAAALSEMAENTKDDPDFRVPTLDWDRIARDVLTLEWIEAVPLSDRAQLEAKGFDLKELARAVIQTFLRHALRDGFFHADMHPGNLFVAADGRLIAVDFGIMGRLGPKERRFLAEILYGFITRDYHRTAEVHFEAGYVPRHHSVESFAQAIRAIGEPIHNRSAEDISMAKLLLLLFEVTALFDMRTRPELLLLQKTMVVVEGVARSLDPKLDMWAVAEPVVREWIERHLGPAGMLEDGAGELGRFLGGVPALLSRGAALVEQLDAITRDGLVLAPETVAAIGRAEARRNRWTAAALWVIAGLLGVLVIVLK
jgi:ubiquinone biosynthesis protein